MLTYIRQQVTLLHSLFLTLSLFDHANTKFFNVIIPQIKIYVDVLAKFAEKRYVLFLDFFI